MSEGLPEAILWGSTAVGQDFCIKYLVWPNLGNNLKEKMFFLLLKHPFSL